MNKRKSVCHCFTSKIIDCFRTYQKVIRYIRREKIEKGRKISSAYQYVA